MARVLTEEHKARLAAGRERAREAADNQAVTRVIVWKQWIKDGSPIRRVPEVPSDTDYDIFRRKGLS
jgi:hypothetical protein